MNPLLVAAMRALKRRRRVCPNCKRKQLVLPEKVEEPVRSPYCGATIPPPEDRHR